MGRCQGGTGHKQGEGMVVYVCTYIYICIYVYDVFSAV